MMIMLLPVNTAVFTALCFLTEQKHNIQSMSSQFSTDRMKNRKLSKILNWIELKK